MARKPLMQPPGMRCVEPVQRMVGGRFGWAYHRFQIKGGITPMQAVGKALSAEANRTSYFVRLLDTTK